MPCPENTMQAGKGEAQSQSPNWPTVTSMARSA